MPRAKVAEALAAIDQEGGEEREIAFVANPGPDAERADNADPLVLAASDAAVLASALAEHLQVLRPGTSLIIRLAPGGIEVGARGESGTL